MKKTISKALLITICASLVSAQTIQCKESSWPFWLGVGAVCLGSAAVATACLYKEDPEDIINRCEQTYSQKYSTFKPVLSAYNQSYGASYDRVMETYATELCKASSSSYQLNTCLRELKTADATIEKRLKKLDRNHSQYHEQHYYNQLKTKGKALHSRISNLIQSLKPLVCDYEYSMLKQRHTDLYQTYKPQEPLSSYIRSKYWYESYPFIRYQKELGYGIQNVESILSDFQSLQKRIDALRSSHSQWSQHMHHRIVGNIQHAHDLLQALLNMHAWVSSSPEYFNEQHIKDQKEYLELERQKQRELERLQNKVDELERQQDYYNNNPTIYVEVHN